MIITFASSKGGVGKSTSCACMAGALAASGASVHIVDLDSNRTVSRWLAASGTGITVTTPDPTSLTEHLEKIVTGKGPDYILIDVAGAYERAITVAMARANLTIIPAAPTEADLFEASRIAEHLKSIYAAFGRAPLYRLLLTQVQTIASHAQAHAIREIERLGLPRFETVLAHRAAYQEIGFSGLPPHMAEQVNRATINKAVAEVDALLAEMTALTASPAKPARKTAA
ncbi:MAG: ParA family protein [Hyphomicrobiaceae bacterium]